MSNLSNIISEVLRNFLPQHLVKLITPRLAKAIEDNYEKEKNDG